MSLHAIDVLLAELNTKEGRWTQAVCADVPAGEELYRCRKREGARDPFRLPRRVGEESLDLLKPSMVHEHRAVHERYVRGTTGLDHLFYFLRIYTHRFLDKDVFPGGCRSQHPLLVQLGR